MASPSRSAGCGKAQPFKVAQAFLPVYAQVRDLSLSASLSLISLYAQFSMRSPWRAPTFCYAAEPLNAKRRKSRPLFQRTADVLARVNNVPHQTSTR